MSADIKLSLEEFKHEAATLLKALPTLKSSEQVANGTKCLNLCYLSIDIQQPWESAIAVNYWKYVSRKALARETELMLGEAN